MTERSPAAEYLRQEIVKLAGGYLASPERIPNVTCAICTAPVDGWPLCLRCRDATLAFPDKLADRVGHITYARPGHQTGTVMRGYKGTGGAPPQEQHHVIVQLLLADALLHHTACAGRLAGIEVNCWAAIPSLSSGRAAHPLPKMIAPFLPNMARVTILPADHPQNNRSVRPENFTVNYNLRGFHLLIVDDTWTTGAQAQSVAIQAKRAGADSVSVLTVARWMDPDWPPSKQYMAARRRRRNDETSFNPDTCPFTAGPCP